MATIQEQSDLAVDIVNQRNTLALDQLTELKASIVDARDRLTATLNAFAEVNWSANVTGVNSTYVPPNALAPDVPAANEVAIGDAQWNQVFLRSDGLLQRITEGRKRQAAMEAAAGGHAQLSPTQAAALRRARDEGDEKSSVNALASATEQAKAEREDVLALVNQRLEKYRLQWSLQTTSEGVRVLFERLALDKVLEPEKGRTETVLGANRLALENANDELVDLIQVNAQLVSALLSGADIGINSSVGLSDRPTVYNPGEGDVVRYPL